jgi:RND family efflux transporter MFP subunit
MPVIRRDTALTSELVGQVSAFREVALRPQVTGIVERILFKPGQEVHRNETLFVIDPRPYLATLAQQRGTVADAEAAFAKAHEDTARYLPLLPDNAIPRQTYDAAVATEKSAKAALDQHRAAVDLAEIDVRNTEVRSPVDGQIGLYRVDIGGLATSGQTILATVSTLDPMYVTIYVTEADYVRYMKAYGTKAAPAGAPAPFTLLLPDGSLYGSAGTLDFVDRAVDSATGTLAVRTTFPNPQNLLRPGMNVRVRLVLGDVKNALLIPQTAVTQLLGKEFVTVVRADNKTEQKSVVMGASVGPLQIVESGLSLGELVILAGSQKAAPGGTVAATLVTESHLNKDQAPGALQ